nr:A disintegrin and metalloproteinase with thrombospondin motifs adt-1-like [Hydra vulgaris]
MRQRAFILPSSCEYLAIIWSQWSEWSNCSDSGLMQRSRICSTYFWLNCYANSTQIDVKSCSNQAFWSQWSEWSCCNASGVTTRSRNCINIQFFVCVGDNTEIKTCISFIGVEINTEKNQLQYKPYNTTISIFYCNNVLLILSFGDGTVKNIKNINASTAKVILCVNSSLSQLIFWKILEITPLPYSLVLQM